ncbi:MAG: hypothetical protein QOG64_2917 [Acidimicrobiaceae bacterium]|nr:hypothetical protein [Acidimicrobiaceae bacterium]
MITFATMRSGPGLRAELPLAADSRSASEARRFLRQTLTAWAADDLVDDAMLAASELVSNAVLYAEPPFEVSAELGDTSLRVAVCDGSTMAPVPRDYGTDATTGRGLTFLESVGQWGVDWPPAGGKIVWVDILRTATAAAPSNSERETPDPVPHAMAPPSAPSGRLDPDHVPVRFLAVPVASYLALQVHNDAILREFELLAISAASGAKVPPRLLEVITEVHGQFSRPRDAYRRTVEDAAARGDATVDLEAQMPPAAAAASERYVALLEEAEGFTRTGALLVEPAPPPVGQLRRWFAEELARQVRERRAPEPAPPQTYPPQTHPA